MKKFFFMHLPKAGGTSIRSAVEALFEPARIAPLIENDVAGHIANAGRYESFRGFDLYSGHYGIDIFQAVADGHEIISNFRHPVDRVYSLYRFFRNLGVAEELLNKRHFRAVLLAKTSTFREFVESNDEILLTYVSDQHARQMTGSPWHWTKEVDLGRAMACVECLAWFYVCEEPEASLRWARAVLGVGDLPRLNISVGSGQPHDVDAVASTILERNRLDLALYERAVSLMRHRSPS